LNCFHGGAVRSLDDVIRKRRVEKLSIQSVILDYFI
jgi:hypothetical protein